MPPTSSAGLPSPGRLFRDRRAVPRPEHGTPLSHEADLALGTTLRRHWPEYGVEALFLGVFVLVSGLASALMQAPATAWLHGTPGVAGRHVLAGIVTGLVLMAMIYSPWGRRSGSHLNPAITLAYLRLGKIGRWDALFYVLAQLAAGGLAVLLLRQGLLLPSSTASTALSASMGPSTVWAAFLTELVLSAGAMLLILYTSNHEDWFRWTGALHALLIMLVAACAAPLSGFGMNLARLLAVDMSGDAAALDWLNLLPPLLGMQLGVEAWRLFTGRQQALCAKLAHNTHGRCIFRCQHPYQARALARTALRRRG